MEFEIVINRKNKDWVGQGVFLELIVWEDFLAAVSKTRLQEEYNQAIRECDIFVMLFCTKVGQYTDEEFETAFGQFKATNKPFIFTYFKDTDIRTGGANKKDLMSLWAFQEKLGGLGHFYTVYKKIDELKLHFNRQLDKLAKNGFIELKWDKGEAAAPSGSTYQANLTGPGAIAQGPGATAVGAGGVQIGGTNTGNINTGTQTIATQGSAVVQGRVALQSPRRPLCLPRQASTRRPARPRRFSGGVAVCPCSLTLTSEISALRDSEHSASGGGAGETSPADSTPQ